MPVHQLQSREALRPSCPSGGLWYACTSGSGFVGCCANDPCSSGCKAGNIYPASFETNQYGKFPDAICDDTGSLFYTCSGTQPPFLGCCKVNPCQNNGCPKGSLTSAHLPANPALACQYFPTGCGSIASTTSSSATATSTPAAPKKAPTGALVGGALGGVSGLSILILILFCCFRHRRRAKRQMQQSQPMIFPTLLTSPTKQPDKTLSTMYSPPANSPPVHWPHSPTLVDAQFTGSPSQSPIANTHHSRHQSYELPGSTADTSSMTSAGLGVIFDSRPVSSSIPRKPISASPILSELSADESHRRAELSSIASDAPGPAMSRLDGSGRRSAAEELGPATAKPDA